MAWIDPSLMWKCREVLRREKRREVKRIKSRGGHHKILSMSYLLDQMKMI
jgi:hypothetical protein